ncbi:hypothetical protein [Jeotgalibaca porci]|uniref:hypothetical protein n=1 Tax=Jeotgalibaca porci TaxID=1868793 RepID=UPI0035A1B91B
MINNLNPSQFQTDLVALLSLAFIMFFLWVNRDKNNKFEENTIKLFAFLCICLTVALFVYAVYKIVGG